MSPRFGGASPAEARTPGGPTPRGAPALVIATTTCASGRAGSGGTGGKPSRVEPRTDGNGLRPPGYGRTREHDVCCEDDRPRRHVRALTLNCPELSRPDPDIGIEHGSDPPLRDTSTTDDDIRQLRAALRGMLGTATATRPRPPDAGWRRGWPALAELGVTAFCVPEAKGGFGLQVEAAAATAHELGAALHGSPFAALTASAHVLAAKTASGADGADPTSTRRWRASCRGSCCAPSACSTRPRASPGSSTAPPTPMRSSSSMPPTRPAARRPLHRPHVVDSRRIAPRFRREPDLR